MGRIEAMGASIGRIESPRAPLLPPPPEPLSPVEGRDPIQELVFQELFALRDAFDPSKSKAEQMLATQKFAEASPMNKMYRVGEGQGGLRLSQEPQNWKVDDVKLRLDTRKKSVPLDDAAQIADNFIQNRPDPRSEAQRARNRQAQEEVRAARAQREADLQAQEAFADEHQGRNLDIQEPVVTAEAATIAQSGSPVEAIHTEFSEPGVLSEGVTSAESGRVQTASSREISEPQPGEQAEQSVSGARQPISSSERLMSEPTESSEAVVEVQTGQPRTGEKRIFSEPEVSGETVTSTDSGRVRSAKEQHIITEPLPGEQAEQSVSGVRQTAGEERIISEPRVAAEGVTATETGRVQSAEGQRNIAEPAPGAQAEHSVSGVRQTTLGEGRLIVEPNASGASTIQIDVGSVQSRQSTSREFGQPQPSVGNSVPETGKRKKKKVENDGENAEAVAEKVETQKGNRPPEKVTRIKEPKHDIAGQAMFDIASGAHRKPPHVEASEMVNLGGLVDLTEDEKNSRKSGAKAKIYEPMAPIAVTPTGQYEEVSGSRRKQ